jgi:hypothetical protein
MSSPAWKLLWSLNIPQSTQLFLWRACQNILPTKHKLFQRKVVEDPYARCVGMYYRAVLLHRLSRRRVQGGWERVPRVRRISSPSWSLLVSVWNLMISLSLQWWPNRFGIGGINSCLKGLWETQPVC